MKTNETSKLVTMLLGEADARNAFMKDPGKFVTDNNLDINEEEIQSVMTVSPETLDTLNQGLDLKNEKVDIKVTKSGSVEVICACGAGYWAKL